MKLAQFNGNTGFPIQHPTQEGVLNVYEKEVSKGDLLEWEVAFDILLKAKFSKDFEQEVEFAFFSEVNDAAERGNIIMNKTNGKISMLDQHAMDVLGTVENRPDSYGVEIFTRYLKD